MVGGLSLESVLKKESIEEKQHFTQPPAHYTEATLVKLWKSWVLADRVPMLRRFQRFLPAGILQKKEKISI